MDAKIVGTSFVRNTVKVVSKANITVGNSLDWEILPIGPDERVCGSLEGCSVP